MLPIMRRATRSHLRTAEPKAQRGIESQFGTGKQTVESLERTLKSKANTSSNIWPDGVVSLSGLLATLGNPRGLSRLSCKERGEIQSAAMSGKGLSQLTR